MCIIDRSKPSVFDTNSLDGIMAGVEAAQWGGPTSGIKKVLTDQSKQQATYNLMGRRVPSNTKGLVIVGGKKVIK